MALKVNKLLPNVTIEDILDFIKSEYPHAYVWKEPKAISKDYIRNKKIT